METWYIGHWTSPLNISLSWMTPIGFFTSSLWWWPYGWWFRNPAITTWGVKKNSVNNGINYQPQLVQEFWTINSINLPKQWPFMTFPSFDCFWVVCLLWSSEDSRNLQTCPVLHKNILRQTRLQMNFLKIMHVGKTQTKNNCSEKFSREFQWVLTTNW